MTLLNRPLNLAISCENPRPAALVLLTKILIFVLSYPLGRETAPEAMLAFRDVFSIAFVRHQKDFVATIL